MRPRSDIRTRVALGLLALALCAGETHVTPARAAATAASMAAASSSATSMAAASRSPTSRSATSMAAAAPTKPRARRAPAKPAGRPAVKAPTPPAWSAPPDTLPDGRRRLFWLDFALVGTEAPGSWVYEGSDFNEYYGWSGGLVRMVRRDRTTWGPYISDGFEGEDAWFVISTDATDSCRVMLTLGDPERARGPLTLGTPAGPVQTGVTTRAGEVRTVSLEVAPVDGRVAVHLQGDSCASFFVSGLAIYPPRGAKHTPNLFRGGWALGTFAGPGSRTLAPIDTTAGLARAALQRYSEYLLRMQPAEGCFSMAGSWYETAYPVRTLLAAGRLLHEPRYTEAALRSLDRFVDDQLEDANWPAGFFGHAGCPLAIETRVEPKSANLADVGTVCIALSVAGRDVDETRRQRYLKAVVRYADTFVLPNQLESGAFPNLRFAGKVYHNPYSVATGVQAANLAGLYALTDDTRYLAAAERAARFLLDNFTADNKINFYAFDSDHPAPTQLIRFGELYYLLEGLLWVQRYTTDQPLADAIQSRFRTIIWSGGGLAGSRIDDIMWRPQDAWESAKTAALLYVLTEFARNVPPPEKDKPDPNHLRETQVWIRDFTRHLATPEQAARFGVGLDPGSPGGRYAFPATGFAGLSIAAAIDPDIMYPK